MFETAEAPATGAPDTGGVGSLPAHDTRAAADDYFSQPQAEQDAAPETATGGETPGEEQLPAMVPSHRLREEAEARRQAEEQLRQFEAFTPYQDLVRTLAEAGVPAEQVLQQLLGAGGQGTPQPEATTPEQQFQQWAESQGYDLYNASEPELRAAQREFRLEQSLERLERAEQAAQQAQAQAQVTADLQQAQQRFPALQDPDAQPLLQAAALAALGVGGTVAQAAEKLNAFLEKRERAALARYSAGKQADSRAPVVAGGSAPPPVETMDYHNLSPTERANALDSYLRASGGPA